MSSKLTKKEKGFADDYMELGNGVQAALQNYDTDDYSTAGVIAHENLKKPKIIEYLESKAEVAAKNIFNLANSAENENVRLSANKDILDRSGFKAVERSINLDIKAEITNPKARELANEFEQKLKENL